jgi:hypothetical protein
VPYTQQLGQLLDQEQRKRQEFYAALTEEEKAEFILRRILNSL